jgi:hypothetical protein
MAPVYIEQIKHINDYGRWEGYHFVMSDGKKNITCKISNYALCYETFGVYTPTKDMHKYIGAEYHSVSITKSEDPGRGERMAIVDVVIYTSEGNIIIRLYNEHNGYYFHDFFTQTEHGTRIESL